MTQPFHVSLGGDLAYVHSSPTACRSVQDSAGTDGSRCQQGDQRPSRLPNGQGGRPEWSWYGRAAGERGGQHWDHAHDIAKPMEARESCSIKVLVLEPAVCDSLECVLWHACVHACTCICCFEATAICFIFGQP